MYLLHAALAPTLSRTCITRKSTSIEKKIGKKNTISTAGRERRRQGGKEGRTAGRKKQRPSSKMLRAFTLRCFSQRLVFTQTWCFQQKCLYTQVLLHRGDFFPHETHRCLYAAMLLHPNAFTCQCMCFLHRDSFDTKQSLHTKAFTQILLRRDGSYAECICTDASFTHRYICTKKRFFLHSCFFFGEMLVHAGAFRLGHFEAETVQGRVRTILESGFHPF